MKEQLVEHLQMKTLQTNPGLMRLIPGDIARRYQALPISMDGTRITIAMAHPEDTVACQVVESVVGTPACIVQVDSSEIERVLDEIWPQNPSPPLRILLWTPTPAATTEIQPYARGLAELLKANLEQADIPWQGVQSLQTLAAHTEQFRPDMVILQLPEASFIQKLLNNLKVKNFIDALPACMLVVRSPRWPLEKILLVLRDGSERHDSAVDWSLRLAQASHSKLTVMPLVPPVPEMYGSCIQHRLPALLAANDPLGKKFRWIAHRFTSGEITGTFKLRHGLPMDQLRSELQEGDPDLIILPAETQNQVERWIVGEVINPLLDWVDRPLLITKPKKEQNH